MLDFTYLLSTGIPLGVIDDLFILGLALAIGFLPVAAAITAFKAGMDWVTRQHLRIVKREWLG